MLNIMPTGTAEIIKQTKYAYIVKFDSTGEEIYMPKELIDNAIQFEPLDAK